MRAEVEAPSTDSTADLCAIAPAAQYRGTENQLYRVEIHSGGSFPFDKSTPPTFKWSRDNGTVAFVITALDGSDSPWTITLQDLGRDSRFSLDVGDWVEIVVPLAKLQDGAIPTDLLLVTAIDPIDLTVTVERALAPGLTGVPQIAFDATQIAAQRPLLRRWDQRLGVTGTKTQLNAPVGVIPITTLRPTTTDTKGKLGWDPDDAASWFELEDGIKVQFQQPALDSTSASFRAGDYWLIPARTASNGSILWPSDSTGASPLPPIGITHYYAALAVVIDPASAPTPGASVIDRRTTINRAAITTGPTK